MELLSGYEYGYDAWGKPTGKTGSLAGTLGTVQPFRYRGYVWDEETGDYYLRSRQYRAEWGRFLGADEALAGNAYGYCKNTPTDNSDPSGLLDEKTQRSRLHFGAARPYRDVRGGPFSPNCYGYVLGLDFSLQPGQISGRLPVDGSDVESVYYSVCSDALVLGMTVRRLSGPNDEIGENEYRVALAVGTRPLGFVYPGIYSMDVYDYHFMVETDVGEWAEKHGRYGNSERHEIRITPDQLCWDLNPGDKYYDSAIIYFAVGKQ